MSENELQSGGDVVVETDNNEIAVADQVIGSELATDTDGQQEPQAQVDEVEAKRIKANEATQKAFNKNHHEKKQAERERDALKAENDAFKAQAREAEAAKVNNLPPAPEEFDPDFEAKNQARLDALILQDRYNESLKVNAQQQLLNQQQQEQAKAQQRQTAAATYTARAVELNIAPDELQKAGNAVFDCGVSQEVMDHLLTHKDGPLMTKYLAGNLQDVITLQGMSALGQGEFLSQIAAKAEALKPKTSNTPAPVENLSGGGAQKDLNEFPNSEGATFT